jgi:hypothetical protein
MRRVRALKISPGAAPEAEWAPLVTRQHLEKVGAYVDLGVGDGAKPVSVRDPEPTDRRFQDVTMHEISNRISIGMFGIKLPLPLPMAFHRFAAGGHRCLATWRRTVPREPAFIPASKR